MSNTSNILPTWKYAVYEIPILQSSSGTQFNFPVNNYLVGRKVYGLECYTSNDMTRSPISTSNSVWTFAMVQAASLTLHTFDPEQPNNAGAKADWIKNLPCTSLHRAFNTDTAVPGSSVNQLMIFAGLVVDWNNSHIDFVSAPNPGSNFSALFGVYYK